MSAPSMSGAPKMHHRFMSVYCSVSVKRVFRSSPKPLPIFPSGSMSASG